MKLIPALALAATLLLTGCTWSPATPSGVPVVQLQSDAG